MAIYTKTARQMLVDLINESNPDLPFSINTVDYEFTNPVNITPNEDGHNTEIRIMAKPSSPYVGNVLLTYRRLNLAYLFRNITPEIQQWVTNGGNSSSSTTRATLHQFLPLFTKKYGINLETSQIRQVNLTEQMGLRGDTFSLQAENNSLVFVGSTQAKWWIGKRRLSELLQIDEIEGRKYPAYNNTRLDDPENSGIDEYRPLLTPLTHHIDFTLYAQENGSSWDGTSGSTMRSSYSNNTTFYRENRYRSILNELATVQLGFKINILPDFPSGSGNWTRSEQRYSVVDYGDDEKIVNLAGIRFRIISLPHADFPEANSEFYNRAIVFIVPEDCPWGIGNIFFHYNR